MKTKLFVLLIFSLLIPCGIHAQEDVDEEYPHRLRVTYPRAGVVISAGDTFSIWCAGRASSLEFQVYLVQPAHQKKHEKMFFLGNFSTGSGPFTVQMPQGVRPGEGYRIYVISGPLEALSEEFTVIRNRNK